MKFIIKNLPKCEQCAIRDASLFGELETEQLDKARSLRKAQHMYAPGDYLYHQGDTPEKAFTVYKGWIILFKILENGDRQILRFGLPGDLLCYKAGKNKILDHSAIAVTDVTLCAFPLQDFSQRIKSLPELSIAISSITSLATERCYSIYTAIASHPAETKVAYLLLSLYVRMSALGKKTEDDITFPITQEDIGDALGLTSIHVNRVIQSLKKQGLIECKNKRLWVKDQQALAGIAQTRLSELKKLMIAL